MAYSSYMHFYLPAAGEQGWGGAINGNFETIDAKLEELSKSANPNAYVPTGCQIIGCSATPAPGWLLCDGSEVLRATYPALFAAIGTAYGTPSSSSKFRLPNKLGRVVVGADPTGTDPDYELGATGGAESVTLQISQIPSHDHSGATGGAGKHDHDATAANAGKHGHTASSNETGSHTHQVYEASIDYSNTMGSGGPSRTIRVDSTTGNAGTHSHTITVNENGEHTHEITVPDAPNHTHTISASGGGGAHENRMPYVAEFWWIKT